MKRTLIAIALLTAIAAPAFGQEARLRAARVTATDVAATAKFYEAALGMREVRKVDRDGKLFEVILNYGATAEEAAASKAAKLVVIARPAGAGAASMSPLVFGVKNVDAAMQSAVKAGGTISREAKQSGTTGRVGFVKDPAGNEIELIQE